MAGRGINDLNIEIGRNGLKNIKNGKVKTKNDKLNVINSERFVNYMWYSPKQWKEWKERGRKDLTNKQKCDIEKDNEKLQSKTFRKRNLRRTYTTL